MIDEKKLIEDILWKVREQNVISEEVGHNRPFCDKANVIECINNQPKIGEWIPCEEEFPSIDGDYEVTVDRDVNGEKINVTEFQYFRSDRGKWESYKNSRFERNVIAWRHNTEPYNPE